MALKVTYKDGLDNSPSETEPESGKDVLTKLSSTEIDNSSFENLYSSIYRESFQTLYNYGMQIAYDENLVKDGIQELFLDLWKNKSLLKKVKRIRPYLFKSLKRKIIRSLKEQKKTPHEPAFQFEISPEVKLIKDQQEAEQHEKLINAYKKLTERQREAIYFKYYEKLSYQDTSSALKISSKATYKLVARAILLLKSFIDD